MELGPRFDQFPYEIQFETLLQVGYPGLISFCRTNRAARDLCNDERLWKVLYEKDFPTIPRRSESAKADYLRVYRILRDWADDFARVFSLVKPPYVNREAQANAVFDLIQYFLQTLPNPSDWQTWANLTDEPVEEVAGGEGGSTKYNEQMFNQLYKFSSNPVYLLKIMLPINDSFYDFLTKDPEHIHINWSDAHIDYAERLERLM